MKAKEKQRVTVIKSALADILTAEKSGLYPNGNIPIGQVIQKSIKRRQESAQVFRQGGRDDLAAQEDQERDILQTFLPRQMTKEEITEKIKEIINGLEKVDLGSVMKKANEQMDASVANKKWIAEIAKSLIK
ncbi:Yqey-like protein-domain-containing protein [Gorgonomyces haynaldii]|nr:Yqey-like protein-domain-containing protein [Gorgonomyces haynaldii]